MATSRIVFYDSPNAPRDSRFERGFSVSSYQSSSASASSGGSAASSRWCWKDKRSRRRDVSNYWFRVFPSIGLAELIKKV